jgi:peptidoglycan/LPS O-acetylase OafA/YrhL
MRLTALDGWRGVLSLIVVLAHFPGHVVLKDTSFYEGGSSIIDLFFLFSGFVIVAHYEGKLGNGYGVKRFLMERLGRIYPIHFVVLMLFVLVQLALAYQGLRGGGVEREAFSGGNTLPALVSNLFLVQSLHVHDMLTWNYPSWSLSTEWAAYVVFACCMLFKPKRFLPFAVVGFIASPILLATLSTHPMSATYDYGFFRSTYGFSAGALSLYAFAWIKQNKFDERFSLLFWNAIEAVAAIAIFALPAFLGLTPYAVLIPAGYMFVLLVFALQKGAISRFMGQPSLAYLGTISLSIYVIHAFVLLRLVNVASVVQKLTGWQIVEMQMFHGAPTNVIALGTLWINLLALATIAFIVLLSHFSYRFIEVPAERRVRQWTKGRAASAEAQKVVPTRAPV